MTVTARPPHVDRHWGTQPAAAGLVRQARARRLARVPACVALADRLLERNDGFKGFNQPGIDGVLRIIDPRRNLVED